MAPVHLSAAVDAGAAIFTAPVGEAPSVYGHGVVAGTTADGSPIHGTAGSSATFGRTATVRAGTAEFVSFQVHSVLLPWRGLVSRKCGAAPSVSKNCYGSVRAQS